MLQPEHIEEFYTLLDEEIAEFNCGAICAARNRNRLPYCCDISKTIPLMYHEEYEYVQGRTRMWRPYKPKAPNEQLDALEYHLYVECPGPRRCERQWRSIICRVFPTYPYMDERGCATGLFFNTCLRDRCHLVGRPDLVRPAFIRSHVQFWNLLFSRHEGEKEFHATLCRQTEARHRRLGKPFVIMMPDATLTKHFGNGGAETWVRR